MSSAPDLVDRAATVVCEPTAAALIRVGVGRACMAPAPRVHAGPRDARSSNDRREKARPGAVAPPPSERLVIGRSGPVWVYSSGARRRMLSPLSYRCGFSAALLEFVS